MSWLDTLWFGAPSWWHRAAGGLVLAPPAAVFRSGVAIKNALFDLGVRTPARVDGAQIVSVGNLVVGGAGKTPVVIFLATWAARAGRRVAVVSRGYGRTSSGPRSFDRSALPSAIEVGDEPRLIARKTGARVFVDADRVRAATAARAAGSEVIVLDDGFQHRRLARDVDVVVHVPGAPTRVLPWGPCREPRRALRRANVVWNGEGSADPQGALEVSAVVDSAGRAVSLEGRSVVVLTGIARPARFVDTVRRLGAQPIAVHTYADHHRFSPAELERALAAARVAGGVVVVTEKDAARVELPVDVAIVETELRVTRNLETLATALGWPSASAPR